MVSVELKLSCTQLELHHLTFLEIGLCSAPKFCPKEMNMNDVEENRKAPIQ